MTPRRGDLEPARDVDADTMTGVFVGAMIGAAGWMVELWALFLPVEWTFGAGWWAPVVACAVLGGIVGRYGRSQER